MAGSNGGAAFLIIYLAIVFSLGLSVMLAEFTIGRAAAEERRRRLSRLAGGPWPVAGFLAVLAGFTVLCFYSVVGGWTLTYLAEAVRGGLPSDKDALGGFFGVDHLRSPGPDYRPWFFHGAYRRYRLRGRRQGYRTVQQGSDAAAVPFC